MGRGELGRETNVDDPDGASMYILTSDSDIRTQTKHTSAETETAGAKQKTSQEIALDARELKPPTGGWIIIRCVACTMLP